MHYWPPPPSKICGGHGPLAPPVADPMDGALVTKAARNTRTILARQGNREQFVDHHCSDLMSRCVRGSEKNMPISCDKGRSLVLHIWLRRRGKQVFHTSTKRREDRARCIWKNQWGYRRQNKVIITFTVKERLLYIGITGSVKNRERNLGSRKVATVWNSEVSMPAKQDSRCVNNNEQKCCVLLAVALERRVVNSLREGITLDRDALLEDTNLVTFSNGARRETRDFASNHCWPLRLVRSGSSAEGRAIAVYCSTNAPAYNKVNSNVLQSMRWCCGEFRFCCFSSRRLDFISKS